MGKRVQPRLHYPIEASDLRIDADLNFMNVKLHPNAREDLETFQIALGYQCRNRMRMDRKSLSIKMEYQSGF